MSSDQWVNQCPKDLVEIARAIAATQGYDRDLAKQCETLLKKNETSPNFGVKLLKILDQNGIPDNVKQGTAIYFKRFVERYWMLEENIITPDDRNEIQAHLIRVMLTTTRLAQIQLSETIATIAGHNFMSQWHKLKPKADNSLPTNWQLLESLVSFLNPNQQSTDKIVCVLGIIRSITAVYVGKDKTEEMVVQIRYIMKQFVKKLWLRFLGGWAQGAVSNFNHTLSNPPSIANNDKDKEHAKYVIQGLEKLVLIFHDLTSVDLIEYFEDSMNDWAKIFLKLLALNDKFNILSSSDDTPGEIDKLRTAVIKSCSLFASRYESESSDHLQTFVEESIKLLATLDDKERYDVLVAETTNYVQTVVKQKWNKNLFDQQKLEAIISRILIRNIRLRESDINRYEIAGDDWVLRDMEGSDYCTRRRGALELLRKLCEGWKQEINQIIQQHVGHLLQRYHQNPKENFVDFDTAINLFLATTVMGETRAEGATRFIDGAESIKLVHTFLSSNVLPYFGKPEKIPHPLVAADCLKFTIMFRSVYPQDMFEKLVGLSCAFLQKKDFVTHTYAAIALDRLLSMKVKVSQNNDDSKQNGGSNFGSPNNNKGSYKTYRYPKAKLVENLVNIFGPLFAVLTNHEDSGENEYVMKAIMRVIIRGQDAIAPYIDDILNALKVILEKVSKNPAKPTFNHFMFEIIAACIHFSCKANATAVVKFEGFLMPLFLKILDNQQCQEFHPYVFQIIGLMLRSRNQVINEYVSIYDAMLKADRWQSDGNIIAISSMFADYYRILSRNPAQITKFMTEGRLNGTLGIYQFLLSQRTQDIFAFRILSALFEYCPLELLDKYVQRILESVFQRLKAQKTNTLCANFVKCLSIIILRHGFGKLYDYCEKIQCGMFGMILERVWIPFCRHVSTLGDRLIVTHAMIIMMSDKNFLANEKLREKIADIVKKIIEIFEVSPLEDKELNSMERRIQTLEDQGAGAKYAGLVFARPPNDTQLTQTLGDPRQALVKAVQKISNMNQQVE